MLDKIHQQKSIRSRKHTLLSTNETLILFLIFFIPLITGLRTAYVVREVLISVNVQPPQLAEPTCGFVTGATPPLPSDTPEHHLL